MKTAENGGKLGRAAASRRPDRPRQMASKESRLKREKEVVKQKVQHRKAQKAESVAKANAELERAKREKEERIRVYKQKRLEKTKAISRKTNRGQPLMKDRMQLLLRQIQDMKRT